MSAADIRNLTFLGSSDSGKTSLVEALALHFGVTKRLGSVNEGTAIADFTAEEKDKKHSRQAAVVHVRIKGGELNLIDTPGYPDYLADAVTSMGAAGIAVLVVAANNETVPFHARRLWRMAGDAGLARAVVVAKGDLDNLEEERIVGTLRGALGQAVVPVTLPDKLGTGFSAVRQVKAEDSPYRSAMVEAIVESDDDLMEKYLESGDVDDADLARTVPSAISKGTLAPLFFVQPLKGIGVKEFADFLLEQFPTAALQLSATRVAEVADGGDGSPLVARVWKLFTDKHLGQVSYLRILQGTLKTDQSVPNPRGGKALKLSGLSCIVGKDLEPVASAGPGSIVAVTRVEDLSIGDTLVTEGSPEPHPFPLPEPFTALAVSPKSREDEQKISGELAKIAKEDPCFRVRRDSVTHEMVAEGLSEQHLDTCLGRLKSRGVGVETRPPRIAYRETVTSKADGHHRHKKQTGGSGQFGEVYLRLQPLERGAGFEFRDAIKSGAIPRQYIPAVQKGIQEQMQRGIMASSNVVDLAVEVYDGKHHDVDSDELSFKMAGAKALQDAFMKARPILLEPIMEVEIAVPSRYFGDVSGDLNTRRGRILGMEADGDTQVLKAQVPLAEMQGYSTPLRSMTAGEGSFTMQFDHYDQVPSHIQEKVVAEIGSSHDSD